MQYNSSNYGQLDNMITWKISKTSRKFYIDSLKEKKQVSSFGETRVLKIEMCPY